MEPDRPKPQFMLLYRCISCGQESGFTENDEPQCRYCDSSEGMELVSRKELTPEVLAERLKALADNMMKNLQSAYASMASEDMEMGDEDPEKELLKIMSRAKNFQEKIHGLELKKPAKRKNKKKVAKKMKKAAKKTSKKVVKKKAGAKKKAKAKKKQARKRGR